MTWASTKVEINFRPSLEAADNWTDITSYILGRISIQRGRQSELERYGAGTCSFTLINNDRIFDFTATLASVLVPRVQVRVTGSWASNTWPLFFGYVQGWPQSYDYQAKMAVVNVTAIDLFDILGQKKFNGGPAATYHRFLQPSSWFRLVGEGDQPASNPDQRVQKALDYQGRQLVFSGDSWANDNLGDPIQNDAKESTAYFTGYGFAKCENPLIGSSTNFTVGGWFRIRPRSMHPVVTSNTNIMSFGRSITFAAEMPVADPTIQSRLRVNVIQETGTFDIASVWGPAHMADDQWHHLVISNEPNLLTLYVDGKLFSTSTAFGTSVIDEVTPFTLGGGLAGTVASVMWCHDIFAYDVTLSAATILNLYEAGANWHGQSSGVRITAMLEAFGLSTIPSNIAPGVSLMSDAKDYSGSLLEAMQDVADAEGGALYIAADGKFTYRGRYDNMLKTNSINVQAVFSDAGSTIRYLEASPTLDTAFLYNQVITSREDGPVYQVDEPVSQAAYEIRSLDRTSLPIVDDNDAIAGAEWLLARYSTPKARLPFVKYSARIGTLAMDAAQALALQDLVTVTRTPQSVGSPWSFDGHIEGMSFEIDLASLTFEVTYNITQFGVATGYLVLTSSSFGRLDTGRLGW